MEFSKELIAKAKACNTEEELKALAKENGIDIPDEEIKLFLADNAEGELADEDLEAVSGGQSGCTRKPHQVKYWELKSDVEFIFEVGDVAQAFVGAIMGNETATVKITDREARAYFGGVWKDMYKYDRISGSATNLGFGWQDRSRFER